MARLIYKNVLKRIQKKEKALEVSSNTIIEESYQMIIYLQGVLKELKAHVLENGFKNAKTEIEFFKTIKPQVLGKLIYYNKVYRIGITCPVNNGKMYYSYYSLQLEHLKQEYIDHICNTDFYRYYRSGRTDRDSTYFQRGNINYYDGLNSIVFEIDTDFSTFFDYKIARIIANELLYSYLLTKISPEQNPDMILQKPESSKDIIWTDSKNALIELIYALYAAEVVSYGKIGIRKISVIFQVVFGITLGDLHHAFHRMKTRTGSRTAFLDHLKLSLEEYMDKDL